MHRATRVRPNARPAAGNTATPGALGLARAPLHASLAALLALGALAPSIARGQPVLGGADDATVARRGTTRIRIPGAIATSSERFGGRSGSGRDGEREPLAIDFSPDSLGARFLPELGLLRDSLGALVGAGDALPVSLGAVRTRARVSTQTIPLSAEVGVLDRVSISATLPITRSRSSVDLRVNEGGATGNVGFNPANASVSAAGSAAARAQNAALTGQIGAARAELQALITACGATPADPRCAPLGDLAAARQLGAEALAVEQRLARVYGAGNAPGARFVPIAGSPLQRSVDARLGELGRRFRGFGVTTLSDSARPAAATSRIGIAGFQRLLVDPAFGIGADSLRSTARAGTGDLELAAHVQWLDTFGGDEGARLAPRGLQLRSTATVGWRFGTGFLPLPEIYFDQPTGTGADALLLRSATDVTWGRRLWATLVVRTALPLADRQPFRIPATPEDAFVPAYRQQEVGRRLGRELELELSPRYTLGDVLGVWGQYGLRTRQRTRHTGRFTVEGVGANGAPVSFDAAVLDEESGAREHRVGFGLTYSTVAPYARRKASLPLEIGWAHFESIAGSGGAVPRLAIDQQQLRIYFQLFGERRGGRSGVR